MVDQIVSLLWYTLRVQAAIPTAAVPTTAVPTAAIPTTTVPTTASKPHQTQL